MALLYIFLRFWRREKLAVVVERVDVPSSSSSSYLGKQDFHPFDGDENSRAEENVQTRSSGKFSSHIFGAFCRTRRFPLLFFCPSANANLISLSLALDSFFLNLNQHSETIQRKLSSCDKTF